MAETADGVLAALTSANLVNIHNWSLWTLDDIAALQPADFSILSATLGRSLRCHLAASGPTLLDVVRSTEINPHAVAGAVLVREALLVVDPLRPSFAAVADPGWWTERASCNLTAPAAAPASGDTQKVAVPARVGYVIAADEKQAPVVRVFLYDGTGSALDGVRHIAHSGREYPGVPAILAHLVRGDGELASDRRPGEFNEAVAAAIYETASEVARFGRLGIPSLGLVPNLNHEPGQQWPAFLARVARVATWTRWHDLSSDLATAPADRCLAPWIPPPVTGGEVADLDLVRVVARWSLPHVRDARAWFLQHADRSQRRDLAQTMKRCGWLKLWAPSRLALV